MPPNIAIGNSNNLKKQQSRKLVEVGPGKLLTGPICFYCSLCMCIAVCVMILLRKCALLLIKSYLCLCFIWSAL